MNAQTLLHETSILRRSLRAICLGSLGVIFSLTLVGCQRTSEKQPEVSAKPQTEQSVGVKPSPQAVAAEEAKNASDAPRDSSTSAVLPSVSPKTPPNISSDTAPSVPPSALPSTSANAPPSKLPSSAPRTEPSNQASWARDAEAAAAYNEAVQACNARRLKEAVELFGKAIGLKPNDASAYQGRVRAYLGLGQKEQALADAQTAVRLASRDPGAYFARGLVYADLQNASAAVEDFHRVLQLQPDNQTARENFLRLTLRGPFREWVSSGAATGAMKAKPALESRETVLDSMLEYLHALADKSRVLVNIPGDPQPARPVGRLPVNVLRYVVINEKTKTLMLVGHYDPRFPTGPIPYLEFLQTACKMMPRWTEKSHGGPGFSLDPLPGEMERVHKTLTTEWVNDCFRKAGKEPNAPEMLGLLQANLGWNPQEASRHVDRLFGRCGDAAQLAETKTFFMEVWPVLQKRRLWLPPEFLAKFGGLAPKIAANFENVPTDTQLARVMFQADFCLKYSADCMPLERYVPGFVTFGQFCRNRGIKLGNNDAGIDRFRNTWKLDKVRVDSRTSGDQTVVEFAETRLRVEMVRTSGGKSNVSEKDLDDYSRLFDQHLGDLARWCPSFQELREAVKILSLARYMQQKGISLQFPEETWHPWKGPDHVDGILSVDVYEDSGWMHFLPSVNGGTDLRDIGKKVVFDSEGGPMLEMPPPVRVTPSLTPPLNPPGIKEFRPPEMYGLVHFPKKSSAGLTPRLFSPPKVSFSRTKPPPPLPDVESPFARDFEVTASNGTVVLNGLIIPFDNTRARYDIKEDAKAIELLSDAIGLVDAVAGSIPVGYLKPIHDVTHFLSPASQGLSAIADNSGNPERAAAQAAGAVMGGKALGAFTAFIWGGAGAALGGIPGAMVGGIAGQAYGDYWGGKIGGKIALRIYDHRMAHK